MKVAILTEVLDRTDSKSGVPYYCEYLLRSLSKLEISDYLYLLRWYEKKNHIIYSRLKEIRVSSLALPKPFRDLIVIFELCYKIKKEKITVVHVLSPTVIGMIFLLLVNSKTILTVHDLYPFVFNLKLRFSLTNFKKWLINKTKRILLLLIKKKIDKFIAVSKNTKEDLVKYLKISQDKVEVIYLAPDKEFRVKKFGVKRPNFVKEPFILAHHMGIGFIEIFYKLKMRGLQHKLVIFGRTGKIREKILRLASRLAVEDEILFTGYISKQTVIDLYNRANLFVRYVGYEGFGLPVLEAMACGCPVIASKVGSLPEIVRGAGLLIDPKNKELWVKMIYRVLTNNKLRERLINKGLERAKKFSWDKVAQQTSNVYQQLQKT